MTDGLGMMPILMKDGEAIPLAKAVHRLGRTDKTTREICKQYGISRQLRPGGPIEVSIPGLEMVKHGDIAALELLRQGKRDDPRVTRYMDFIGLQY
jgi:hypothetical protein